MLEKFLNAIKTYICRIIFKYEIENDKWIFSSTDNNKFNYNSKYIFEYILYNEPQITPYYIINENTLRKELKEKYGDQYFITTKSISGILTVLSSRVWMTSAGLPLYGIGLGKQRIIVNLWHGVPLKKIALMENNYGALKKLYFKKIFSDNYTYILTTSDRLVKIMKDSFAVNEDKIKVWGQPRNDILLEEKNLDVIKMLYPNFNGNQKLILYAPTYRDYGDVKLFPFDDYNKNVLNQFLEENNSYLLIRTHIYEDSNNNIDRYLDNRIKILDNKIVDDIMDVLNLFDVLITDYSSIYIDYLLLDRPMIFIPYDKKEYLNKRGMNFEYDEVTPGYKPQNMIQFLQSLNMILKNKDEFRESRKLINSMFNDIRKPCSKDICSYIKEDIKNYEIGKRNEE